MDIRHAVHPEQMKTLDTAGIRKQFLVEGLFERANLRLGAPGHAVPMFLHSKREVPS